MVHLALLLLQRSDLGEHPLPQRVDADRLGGDHLDVVGLGGELGAQLVVEARLAGVQRDVLLELVL